LLKKIFINLEKEVVLMKISISKCVECKKNRLVDKVGSRWICFACKQKIGKQALMKSITEFVNNENN